ncbi:MAG: site-2 protease family protein [Chloroflexota bacterium]
MSIEPIDLLLIAIFLLVAFPVHEFAHAAVAYMQGDATAKLFGRMTLNPVVHFDPIGGLMTIVSVLVGGFLFGWAKPTPVNTANLRDRRNGEVWVALAGPASNLVMAILGAFVFRLLFALDVVLPEIVWQGIWLFVVFNVALAIFNLIPIPPLDGSVLLFRVLSPRQAWELRPMLAQYGIFVLIAFILLLSRPLSGLIFGVADFLVGA